MKTKQMNIVEVLVILFVIFIFSGLFLPATTNRVKVIRITCANNLKQVGISYRFWANDNSDMFPMRFFTNQDGSLKFADATNCFRYFQVMSNELNTPRVLVCPADNRVSATNFTTDLNNSHLSYFIGLDATGSNTPAAFLAGDWNLTNGQRAMNGILYLQTNQSIGWTKELHNKAGNVAMADGSVQQLSSPTLNHSLTNTGFATNRLLLP